ncbi:MAG: DUF4124 domain-containing protein [Rhodanobacteraceae bacterium]|nr:DUF4124 domain-containing protein [Rhodanobacteraceae bacterium]
MLRYLLTAIAMNLLACPALAATIYKCRQAGGVTSYQDSPCPGRQIGVLRTPTTAAQARAPAAPAAAPATAPAAAGTSRARPVATGRAARPSFKCVRPDGSVYFTGDARPRRTLIDLDRARQLLPLANAPAAPPGKAWAEDQCATATRADTCQYYREQIASNDAAQLRARSDELRKLTREGQRLKAIFNHRCG